MKLKDYNIILASNSPQKELLRGLDLDFEVRVLPDVSENHPDSLDAADIPLYVSREKAEAYKDTLRPHNLLLTADTMVILGSEASASQRTMPMPAVCSMP